MSAVDDQAEDFVRERWLQIQSDLRRVGVAFTPDEVFETPRADGETVQVRPNPDSRVGIVAAADIPDLLNGQVVLEICETYSYAELKADPGAGEHLRLPVLKRPSILAVAGFILLSFQYEKWLEYARADAEVLNATRLFCAHVSV